MASAAVSAGLVLGAVGAITPAARGQLRPDQVLVVYDARIEGSREVAEYYAGSAAVPGGAGGLEGARKGVRAVNLATLGAEVMSPGSTTQGQFTTRLRDPLRQHMIAANLARAVRCIVLCKGLPHRINDSDNPVVGDNPPVAEQELNSGDYNCASVDSELTLLWQNLSSGENGLPGDSVSDGLIVNPYARRALPISAFSTVNIRTTKTFTPIGSPSGVEWQANSGALSAQLTPGDIYLVCRLDGHTVADVRGAIDRARNIVVNTDTATFILDESNSNGTADNGENAELDNQGPPELRAGDDYELTRDLLLADRRFDPANVRYNALGGNANFFVGPRIEFDGLGIVVRTPVLLLASEGANHSIFQFTPPTPAMGLMYASSFKFARGCVFNSIESANGRDFGGLGGNFGQAQCADFLAAGGTLAIGNVWEPFSVTVADNGPIVSNFLLGSLSWAEAAYAALPCLSFQQIVLGDPLARVVRAAEDLDGDGAMTVDDLAAFERAPRDLNRDGVSNSADRAIMERAVRGFEATGMTGSQR
ncbi:MAG: hypothetical protein ACT4PL_10325 [Phycisphaerales bacterium]